MSAEVGDRHRLEGASADAARAIELGLKATGEDRLRALRWEHFYWANSADLTADKAAYPDDQLFWLIYARRQLVALGASNKQADELAPKVTDYMARAYKPESVVPEDVMRLLPVLKERGYVLAVLSNREKSFREEILIRITAANRGGEPAPRVKQRVMAAIHTPSKPRAVAQPRRRWTRIFQTGTASTYRGFSTLRTIL